MQQFCHLKIFLCAPLYSHFLPYVFISLGWTPRSGVDDLNKDRLNFVRNWQARFQNVWTILYPISHEWELQFFCIHTSSWQCQVDVSVVFVSVVVLLKHSVCSGNQTDCILHSSVTNDFEHLFMCLLASYTYIFFGDMLKSFIQLVLLSGWFVVFLLKVEGSYALKIGGLFQIHVLQIPSFKPWLIIFYFLNGISFSFMDHAFVVKSGIYLSNKFLLQRLNQISGLEGKDKMMNVLSRWLAKSWKKSFLVSRLQIDFVLNALMPSFSGMFL